MDSSSCPPPTGLLLVGHGTRSPAGIAEFLSLARLVAEKLPDLLVEPAFLELVEPTIAEGIRRMAQRGAEQVVVSPLLLFAAGHATRDLPEAVAAALVDHRGLEARLAPHLGCHPALLELSSRRYAEALAGRPHVRESETLLLMVGRGSRNPAANGEMAMCTRLRWEAQRVGWAETCFAALAEPSLERALSLAARLDFRRVVVQPHLLFQGELLEGIRQTVASGCRRWPAIDWAITERLGPDPLLAEATINRAGVRGEGRAPELQRIGNGFTFGLGGGA